MSARHRILRRGQHYGPPLFDLEVFQSIENRDALKAILGLEDDGRERGIHFLCINASIKSQFELIQQAWAKNPRFNGLAGNPDPLIGVDESEEGNERSMFIPGCPMGPKTPQLPRFVSVRGGAYFFMPGIRTLRFLAGLPEG